MSTVISKDGTAIAYDRFGNGPALILAAGALGYRAFPLQQRLAELLSAHFTVFNYDRRGRGDSGDTLPYSVDREIDDIEALIDAAGGSAYLYGVSSGAILALEAAERLSEKIPKLALYEPPLILDGSRPPLPRDYVERLNAAIASGRRDQALEIFMTQALLIPAEYLAPMKSSPMWNDFMAVAHTLAYDGMVARDVMAGEPLPPGKWSRVSATTTIITGELSERFFHDAANALAGRLPDAKSRTLAGQGHDVAPDAVVPALVEFFGSRG
ncbi:alpha/beta fold hydrolase [Cohnella caldifontis]|uniref:alpha/beta fold hydrolase n=1 Tax=Cohnella caldifontis TaxID=3027471 RepID=UPI0023ED7A0A|nr:alpha/beta hydrolase [Cohnella sp. YIM B05605]